jgi:hypothetical protein
LKFQNCTSLKAGAIIFRVEAQYFQVQFMNQQEASLIYQSIQYYLSHYKYAIMEEKNKITVEKLEIYKLFKGNNDSFARSANNVQKKEISSYEWDILDELYSDYHIIKRNLAAEQFEVDFKNKLNSNFYNQEAIQRFYLIYNQIKGSE